jgi:hypothetical protein
MLLGFALPPLLVRLYPEVANGGFGPDYKLFPLISPQGCTAVAAYQELREQPRWPEGVLPILDWGCGMYAAVDCYSADATVLLFEPNAVEDDWSRAWFVDAESLSDWLETWISGVGWYEEEAVMGDSPPDPRLWLWAPDRLNRELTT